MLQYDNIDDVKGKLVGTYVYHKGKAVIVKGANPKEGKKFDIIFAKINARQLESCELDDPNLNFMNFNLGYTNLKHSAVWWYRYPIRQYRQGLKGDQLGRCASNAAYVHNTEFSFKQHVVDMMENKYPSFDEVEKLLKDQEAQVMAFHRDFAVSWDKIHQDYIIEYKGKTIGCMHTLKDVKLMDDYKHLTEAFKEAVA